MRYLCCIFTIQKTFLLHSKEMYVYYTACSCSTTQLNNLHCPSTKGRRVLAQTCFPKVQLYISFTPTISPSDHWPIADAMLLWLNQWYRSWVTYGYIFLAHSVFYAHSVCHYGSCRTLQIDALYDNCVSMVTGYMYVLRDYFDEAFNCWRMVIFVQLVVFSCVGVYMWVLLRCFFVQINN